VGKGCSYTNLLSDLMGIIRVFMLKTSFFFHIQMTSISSHDLNLILLSAQSDPIDLIDLTLSWIRWFSKRGHKYLTDAAKNGYSEATIDLPYEIASVFHMPSLILIKKNMAPLFPGCAIQFIEDEYNSKPICRLVISWVKNTNNF
jgi:hypothetical protein